MRDFRAAIACASRDRVRGLKLAFLLSSTILLTACRPEWSIVGVSVNPQPLSGGVFQVNSIPIAIRSYSNDDSYNQPVPTTVRFQRGAGFMDPIFFSVVCVLAAPDGRRVTFESPLVRVEPTATTGRTDILRVVCTASEHVATLDIWRVGADPRGNERVRFTGQPALARVDVTVQSKSRENGTDWPVTWRSPTYLDIACSAPALIN